VGWTSPLPNRVRTGGRRCAGFESAQVLPRGPPQGVAIGVLALTARPVRPGWESSSRRALQHPLPSPRPAEGKQVEMGSKRDLGQVGIMHSPVRIKPIENRRGKGCSMQVQGVEWHLTAVNVAYTAAWAGWIAVPLF